MTHSLAHICILTRDLEATSTFYCQALGMKRKFDFFKDGNLYGFYLEMSDGNYIEAFRDDAVGDRVSGPFLHLCLETDDIEASRQQLMAAGVAVSEIKKGCDNTFQIWFKDPNGLDIELHQYTAQSSQRTGADCIVDW